MPEQKFTLQRPDGKKIVGIIAGLEKGRHKPALILLHGLTGLKEQKHIEYPAQKIANQGFVTIRFDSTDGLGESDGNVFNCNTADYLKDLEIIYTYVNQLDGIDQQNIHLFGTSWGGMIAYHFRHKNKLKSIILHEPTFNWQKEKSKRDLTIWKKQGFIIKHSNSKNIDIKIGYQHYQEGLKYDNPKAISEIKVAVLFIQGRDGVDNTPAESMNNLIANLKTQYEIKILANTPHSGFNNDQAEKLTQVILDWLREHS